MYGINKLYEPYVQLIDWGEGRVMGSVGLLYSCVWKIKEFVEVWVSDDGLEFVSCGVQHLAYWQYTADTLTYSSFGQNTP